MDKRNGTTKLSNLCRQLSVLILVLGTSRISAQPSIGTRNAINDQATMNVPGMTNSAPTMFVQKITVGPTQNSEQLLQSFYFNEDLTLGVQYNYQFDIDFRVDSPRGRAPVPDGWYLLTVATFLKDGRMFDNPAVIDPNETLADRYTTSNRPRLVRVVGGTAHPDVSLRFDNPSRASVDNTLYVEFRPVECPRNNPNCIVLTREGEPDMRNSNWIPKRGFATNQYLMSAPWVPSLGVASGGTDPNKRSTADTELLREKGLDSFANQVEIDRQRAPRAQNAPTSFSPLPPARYAAKHNLTLLDVEDAQIYDMGMAFMKADPRPLLRTIVRNRQAGPLVLPRESSRLQVVLCGLISKFAFAGQTKEQQAIRQRVNGVRISLCDQGELNLQMRRINNVGQVTDQFAKANYMDTFKGALMRNISVSRSHDESATSTKTWKVWNTFFSWMGPISPIGTAMFVVKDVLGAIPFDWTHTATISNSRNQNESNIASLQKYMDIIPIMVTAQAANVQTCLEVTTDPASRSILLNQRDPSRPRGLLICGPMLPRAKIQEFFMIAYSRMSETSVNGPFNRLEQRVNVNLRGDREVTTFFREILGNLKPEPGEKDLTGLGFPEWFTDEAARYFARPPLTDPGVISAPVVFGRDHTPPSLLSKLWGSYSENFKYLKD